MLQQQSTVVTPFMNATGQHSTMGLRALKATAAATGRRRRNKVAAAQCAMSKIVDRPVSNVKQGSTTNPPKLALLMFSSAVV